MKRMAVILSCVLMGASLLVGCDAPSQDSNEDRTWPSSPDKQAARRDLIQKLIGDGVFSKVDFSGDHPLVWVRPAFYRLDFDTKQTCCNVVFAYFYQGRKKDITDVVGLRDVQTGKSAGIFSPELGLDLH